MLLVAELLVAELNLPIKDMLGQGVLSLIKRCLLF